VPVLIALTPYGKDDPPERHSLEQDRAWRALGLSIGRVRISEATAWEAPDPAYWVPRGYAVVHVDLRGFFKSEGVPRMFSRTEIDDYVELTAWAGTRGFSNGKVGLHGVSYLAIAQWYAAALNPPYLEAICPWEGASDPYRDVLFHGGIPETAFVRLWSKSANRGARHEGGSAPPASPPVPTASSRTPLLSELKLHVARLEDIRIPALICGSFSDQGLHTRGSFDAFVRISSPHKWLYTHGGGKWERFYGEDALAYQLRFFDCFLKGVDNGMRSRPSVRLEVRHTRETYEVREEPFWPILRTTYRPVYLDPEHSRLSWTPLQRRHGLVRRRSQARYRRPRGALLRTRAGPKRDRGTRMASGLPPRARSGALSALYACPATRAGASDPARRGRSGRGRDPAVEHVV
jgi:predicted acyl esterase